MKWKRAKKAETNNAMPDDKQKQSVKLKISKKQADIFSYIALVIVIIALIPAIFLVIPSPDTNLIASQQIKLDYFTADVEVRNIFQEKYVAPNDLLTFKIMFSTTQPDPVTLSAELDAKLGDDVIKLDSLGTYTLENDGSQTGISVPFHLDKIGGNILRVTIHLLDATFPDNYGGRTSWTFTYLIPVQSQNDILEIKTIASQNFSTNISILLAAATVAALIAIVLISNRSATIQEEHKNIVDRQGEKENQLSEKDLNQRILYKIFENLSEPRFRDAREGVYGYRKNYDSSQTTDDDKKVQTCYRNNLGQQINTDLVKTNFGLVGGILHINEHILDQVFDLYGDTIFLSWYASQPEIEYYRRVYKDERHMTHYKWLFEQCDAWYDRKGFQKPILH